MRNNYRWMRFIKYISFDNYLKRARYERISIKEQKVFIMPSLDVTYISSCD
jgi:hypothetical protein